MINIDLLMDRCTAAMRGTRYRGFLVGILIYYITDAAWGILAGLGWTGLLYVNTVFFFLALAMFAIMWCRFVITYLCLGKWPRRVLLASGYALLAVNAVLLTANIFTGCVFYFDEHGKYLLGDQRDLLFFLLIVYHVVMTIFVLVKAMRCRDSVRSRNMMIFVNGVTLTAAITLQVIWPLTPFTALGCLIGNCFLHVFVIKDEQTARHMAELEKALERVRSAEKARSLFFSIVSHDIRTPLNTILGYSELLQNGDMGQTERDEALKSIRASGTTLLQLVNDVLDLAKMDAGKIALQPGPLKLDKLIDDVFASFRLSSARKGIELVNKAEGVPTVMLDEHRLRQILFNLIGNAVKFTERGSVTVAASFSDANLDLSVSDTGCGIAPEMLTRVFDPFFQVQDPSRSSYHEVGTGLGLPICKNLVEAMGGELVAESEFGRGTVFRIRIPGVEVNECSEPADDSPPDAAPAKLPKHVLVVDDSPVNRLVLAAFLKRAGIALIDYAGDGKEALAKLDSAERAGSPHDFVFTDFWMPSMNGIEFVEKLRADSRFSSLRAFAVTADTEARNDDRIRLFDGILLKPLTYDKLMEVFASDRPV